MTAAETLAHQVGVAPACHALSLPRTAFYRQVQRGFATSVVAAADPGPCPCRRGAPTGAGGIEFGPLPRRGARRRLRLTVGRGSLSVLDSHFVTAAAESPVRCASAAIDLLILRNPKTGVAHHRPQHLHAAQHIEQQSDAFPDTVPVCTQAGIVHRRERSVGL